VDVLREAYFSLKREAAPGVDGETWRHYGENLEEHLQDLSGRLARGAYRASPVQRVYVPKADGRQRPAVDLDNDVITISEQIAKRARARLVPLHPTTADALKRYASTRERLCPKPGSTRFFLSAGGTRLDRHEVSKTLRTITTTLGLRTETVHPHAHHLRHSFAVRTLIDWQRSGADIDERIAALSTYLGHLSPAESYWYLTATPELMGAAADRLEQRFGARP